VDGVSPPDPVSLRALVVDDEPLMVRIASLMLENLGFRVDTACDGREALQRFLFNRYDLVLTDLVMPGMDGHELARWVKLVAKDTVVIMMTGASRNQVNEKMREEVADHWLFKAFSVNQLAGLVGAYFPAEVRKST